MTQQLIPVFNGELDGRSQQLCNARVLHEVLGVGRHFSNWIQERIEKYELIEGYDYNRVTAESLRDPGGRGGRNRIDYHLSLSAAKSLAMIENNALGREVRKYFIAMEKEAVSKAREEVTPAQFLTFNKVLTALMKSIRTERCKWTSDIQYQQIKKICALLDLPIPPYEAVAAPDLSEGNLFPHGLQLVK